MDSEVASFFRDQFRQARATALQDAEGFQEIIFVLEQWGMKFVEHRVADPRIARLIRKCLKGGWQVFFIPAPRLLTSGTKGR